MGYEEALLGTAWEDLPPEVQAQARRCLKDILATAAGSLRLPTSEQLLALVGSHYGPGDAPLWFRGRKASTVGSAWGNAQAVDSLDCHDGFRPVKGHCGATVVPVVVGACAACRRKVSGAELLTAIVMGYEIAARAGLAVHAVYDPHYHASGSWAALGAAAAACRVSGVPGEEVDHVVGMAEYCAPMSPMLRCTEHPSIVKDAAGPGAWAAATALALHDVGGPGLPSILTTEAVGREHATTLGQDWMILRQYFKPYPTCRWTHPPVEGAKLLQQQHGFAPADIESIEIETFDCAAGLVFFPPKHSDAAQYSLPWGLAAFLVDGELGVAQVHPDRLNDPDILQLGRRVQTRVAPDLQARFPEEALARTAITLKDGRVLRGPTLGARGDWTDPLTQEEMDAKAAALMAAGLGTQHAAVLISVLDAADQLSVDDLLQLL